MVNFSRSSYKNQVIKFLLLSCFILASVRCDLLREKISYLFMSKQEIHKALASCIAVCLAGDKNNPKLAGGLSQPPVAYCIFKKISTEDSCVKTKNKFSGKKCSARDENGTLTFGVLGQIVWSEDTKKPKNENGRAVEVSDCESAL